MTTSHPKLVDQPKRILVVPMAWERWWLLGGVWAGRRRRIGDIKGWQWGDWFVVSPGIGIARSRAMVKRLGDTTPEEIWLVGICGGLCLDLDAGDLVKVTDNPGGESEPMETPKPVRLLSVEEREAIGLWTGSQTTFARPIFEGAGFCSERILSTAEKQSLMRRGAIVEMESLAWQEWCEAAGIPLIHLRVVSDPVDREPLAWNRLGAGIPAFGLGRRPPEAKQAKSAPHQRKPSARSGWLPGGVRDWLISAYALNRLGKCLRSRADFGRAQNSGKKGPEVG